MGRRVVPAVVAVAALLGSLGMARPAVAGGAPLAVTLGFDDGYADQTRAADILAARGMTATYFLISGRLDTSGRLTTAQALALQAAGNEIGGHTVDHPFLSTQTLEQQRVEICDDRAALAARGLAVTSLAYPHGDFGAETEQIAAACGYASARTIAGVGCGTGCAAAESPAPPDVYATRAFTTNATTTVQRLQGLVTAAEAAGGWVQLVFHHVCAADEACGPNVVAPADLAAFADWLAGERAAGRLSVRTTGAVIGGAGGPVVRAGVVAPGPLRNPSLEQGAGALPDCWTGAGFGDSAATFTRVGDAHTGTSAVRIEMTAWSSGDRKLISRMDAGTCAPHVSPGRRYVVHASYRSASAPRLIAYVRSAAGTWTYLAKSPPLPATTAYRAAAWTTPPLPADATAISVGMLLERLGSVTVDDFDLVDAALDNLVVNGSFEADADADGLSDCAQRSAYGTNAGTFTRSADAHLGSWAEGFSVTSLSSGDRKVLSSFAPACAPAAAPGHAYLMGAWYRSDAPVRLLVYYRDGAGTWRFWTKSAPVAASSAWTAATLRTPPAPADATALSAGVLLDRAGNTTVDDLLLADMTPSG